MADAGENATTKLAYFPGASVTGVVPETKVNCAIDSVTLLKVAETVPSLYTVIVCGTGLVEPAGTLGKLMNPCG